MSTAVISEARRIEEDCEHSAKGHFNAVSTWQRVHYAVGLPTVVLAALAGAAFFANETPVAAAIMSALAAALAAVSTFLNPSGIAAQHRAAGRQYLTLRNETRVFRELDAAALESAQAVEQIKAFARWRNELNEASPDIPRSAYERAKKDIDGGRATYKVDMGS